NGLDREPARAAAHVQQKVLRLQAARHQEIELERAHFIPQAADDVAMLAGFDPRANAAFIVVRPDKCTHGSSPLGAAARSLSGHSNVRRSLIHASQARAGECTIWAA